MDVHCAGAKAKIDSKAEIKDGGEGCVQDDTTTEAKVVDVEAEVNAEMGVYSKLGIDAEDEVDAW